MDVEINKKDVRQGYQMDDLDKHDFMERVKPILGTWYQRESDLKLVKRSELGQLVDNPWVHVSQKSENRCDVWHHMIFNCFNVLPSKCMDCYKVVVAPRTLTELFKLLDVQKSHYTGGACKCGIEQREYTHKLYGGYFYNRGLEEGKQSYKMVRMLVDEHISPNVPVSLKRACTEFELRFGPSDKWEETIRNGFFVQPITGETIKVTDIQERDHWEAMIDAHVDIGLKPSGQNHISQIHIMQEWIKFAWRHGDPTTKDHNGGDPLYTPSVTYHEGGSNGKN